MITYRANISGEAFLGASRISYYRCVAMSESVGIVADIAIFAYGAYVSCITRLCTSRIGYYGAVVVSERVGVGTDIAIFTY
jgi:hypothetical protein